MDNIFAVLAVSLLFTIALELAFSLAVGKRDGSDLLLIALVNVVTNPAVVICAYMISSEPWFKLLLEAAAILVEAAFYKAYAKTIKRPLLFSLCANVFSFSCGMILNMMLLRRI